MTVYLPAAMMIVVSTAFLWWRGARGPILTLGIAAMLFGGAGYALMGRPALEAKPVAARPDPAPPMVLKGAREAFYGRFNRVEQWGILADSFTARGKTGDAAKLYASALREHPRNFALWSLYGMALADHSGTLTPASRLAFERAVELGQDAPGPRFFRALAQVRAGEGEEAIPELVALAASNPEQTPRRRLIDGALEIAKMQVQASTGS